MAHSVCNQPLQQIATLCWRNFPLVLRTRQHDVTYAEALCDYGDSQPSNTTLHVLRTFTTSITLCQIIDLTSRHTFTYALSPQDKTKFPDGLIRPNGSLFILVLPYVGKSTRFSSVEVYNCKNVLRASFKEKIEGVVFHPSDSGSLSSAESYNHPHVHPGYFIRSHERNVPPSNGNGGFVVDGSCV